MADDPAASGAAAAAATDKAPTRGSGDAGIATSEAAAASDAAAAANIHEAAAHGGLCAGRLIGMPEGWSSFTELWSPQVHRALDDALAVLAHLQHVAVVCPFATLRRHQLLLHCPHNGDAVSAAGRGGGERRGRAPSLGLDTHGRALVVVQDRRQGLSHGDDVAQTLL